MKRACVCYNMFEVYSIATELLESGVGYKDIHTMHYDDNEGDYWHVTWTERA